MGVRLLLRAGSMSDRYSTGGGHDVLPFLSKLESLAGSAVRAAGKVEADLIVVYTATGGFYGQEPELAVSQNQKGSTVHGAGAGFKQ